MSKTLSRLRTLFSDPLFTRSSHGMQPTPKAQELARDLSGILTDINQLVSSSDFDPAQCDAEVNLALSEYIGVTLLPALADRLQVQAPNLHLRVITRVENQLEQLAMGNLDFAIHIRQSNYGHDFRVEDLGGSPPVLLVREGHPLSRGIEALSQLGDYPVIRLYISDREQLQVRAVDQIFDMISPQVRGSLEISHLMTAMEVLRSSDYYMPGPAFLMQNEGVSQGITALPFPGGEELSVDYVLASHNRTANSPLHNWLWEQITCTIRELRPTQPRKLRQRVAAGSTELRQSNTNRNP